MSTKTISRLSDRQVELLTLFPVVGTVNPVFLPRYHDKSFLRTWESLQKKGLISLDMERGGWVAHWGFLSDRLHERVFPGETRRVYNRELKRLNEMALDFSEGSNANFMRQVTVVKNLREMLIRAENISVSAL